MRVDVARFKTLPRGCASIAQSQNPEPNGWRGLSHSYPVRVLVAEDFVPYRRFTCSALASLCGLQIVGEISVGLEAIQKAVELRPDLIVLDIGLLCLNGIETARQIRKLVPDLEIIFLSQESSSDMVQVALSLGARRPRCKKRDRNRPCRCCGSGPFGNDVCQKPCRHLTT